MTGEEELISCRQRMEDLTFPRGLVCCFKGFGKSNILFIIIPALACLVYLSSSIIKPNPKKSKCNIYLCTLCRWVKSLHTHLDSNITRIRLCLKTVSLLRFDLYK